VTRHLFFGTVAVIVLLANLAIANPVQAQTNTTGAVTGAVTDASGAGVSGAAIELKSSATNVILQATANGEGHYTFPSVQPGQYTLTATAPGFRKSIMVVTVEVSKSVLGDIALQIGNISEVVTVRADSRTELQTTNSSIGDVIGEVDLERLPTTQRKVSELVYLQVATTPLAGVGSVGGGQFPVGGSVAGARADQNTATLDGVVITDIAVGGETSGNISLMPLPVDAIQEFRGTVSTPNETQSRSDGGQFSFTTRRGTDRFRGTAYYYLQNDSLDANSWTSNALGQQKPKLKDNRYGGRMGGPLWKDKTFFFLFFEGRDFPQFQETTRIGISDSLRQGVLKFRDATGSVVSYDLKTSMLCGSVGNLPCDPRGIGLSPVIQDYFKLYPTANDPSSGDGLNTIGVTAPVDTSSKDYVALLRLDHNLTSKWRLQGTFMYQDHNQRDASQADFDPSVTNGALLKGTASHPSAPRFLALGATGQLTSNLVNEFRFGWNKQDLNREAVLPSTLVPAAGSAIMLGGGQFPSVLGNPGDPTAGLPFRTADHITSVSDNLTWVKGKHVIGAGVNFQWLQIAHSRFDRGASQPETPVAQITGDIFQPIPDDNRPPTCAPPTVQTNCIQPGDVGRWDALYASTLGIWDNTRAFYVRDAQGKPVGFKPYSTDNRWKHIEITGGDTWRVNSSVSLSFGANFEIETPFKEANGKQTLLVDASSGKLIHPWAQLAAKAAAAAQGNTFNQTMAYVPADGRGVYPTIVNLGPRVGLAWNPSFASGILGGLFGNRKTVIRGGYSLIYDSTLGTELAVGAMFGNQLLGNSVSVRAPTCDEAGTPGPGCITGTSPFRVGVDGQPFLPPPAPLSIPLVPTANSPVNGGFAIDPNFSVGRAHGFNLTIQRQLPARMLLEVGWIGKYARNQSVTLPFNAPPVNIKDVTHLSTQTFAQAFDAVAMQLRGGVAVGAVTPQPWFENLFGAGGTSSIASQASSLFITGTITPLFQQFIDPELRSQGMPTILNQQYSSFSFYTTGAWSNYDAFFTSVRKSYGKFSMAFNYTWSHCRDLGGVNEDFGGVAPTNPYNLGFDYGDCFSDIRHNIQAYGTYELPSVRKGWLNPLTRGWSASYIFIWHTGFPLLITQSGDPYGGGSGFGSFESVRANGPVDTATGANHGVTGSNGIGTAGDPAAGGFGINLFSDPSAVYNSLRPFLLSQDTRSQRGLFRTLGYWNLDFSAAKRTTIRDKVAITLSFDFFNIFNKVNFSTPSLTVLDPANFGVVTGQVAPNPGIGDTNVGPRRIQAGLRVEF
jgi:hypothetical protein